jgi:hypothetical protein
MKKQRGIGFFGLVIMIFFIVLVAVIFMKVTPAYIEYFGVKRAMGKLKNEMEGTPKDIRAAFDRQAVIDDIKSVRGNDLDIAKEGGANVASVSYQVTVPLFANVSILLDFDASTK